MTTYPERSTDLHSVIGDAPAAVLVVDLGARAVVHANDVAQQLAPGVRLPVPLEHWSDAAQLRDPDGTELSDTEHPLSRLLRAEPVPGQRVSAQRRSEMGEEREPLWVVGLPMTGAPMLDDHALVVFLSVREHEAAAAVEAFADQDAGIRDRAVLATGLSFTVADARQPDMPLVWVNPAFTASTGYGFEEAVGRNCRFLQGPDTDRTQVARIRAALAAREAVTVTLLNYRKDGLAFWNQVTMTPILDADGEVSHYVGVQGDVSGRIEADRQRDEALLTAQQAQARAEDAQARLQLLALAGESLSSELDVRGARDRLLQLLVPSLADVAVLLHIDESGALAAPLARHHDPDRAALATTYGDRLAALAPPTEIVATLLGGATSRPLGDDGAELVVGLPGRPGIRDLVVLRRDPDRAPFSPEDVETAVDLGRRAGLILDNLRLYATQSLIAQTLQRSLLPEVPDLPGVRIEARYLAGADGAEVGGDFYDVLELAPSTGRKRRTFGVAVGDVSGHDVYAAAAMGQLKGVLRATATTQRLRPASVLEQIDRLLPTLSSDPPVATMLFALFEPHDDGSWSMTLSTAGHPAPLLRRADGRHEFVELDGARGPLLGYGAQARGQATVRLEPGSTLIAYTDGLIERRGENLDVGFGRLQDAAAESMTTPGELTDHLVGRLARDEQDPNATASYDVDDIVIVAVHLDPVEA